jgi:5-hydroxyisourate hydrolase
MSATRSPITTHILDLNRGAAVPGVAVVLELLNGSSWKELARGTTSSDGRIENLLTPGSKAAKGTYRLTFDTRAQSSFYPNITISFELSDPDRHHHIPLLLSPFGYSTYRGT